MHFEPCEADGARAVVHSKFDEHVALQKENFLVAVQQEEAKVHGKVPTKHDRLVLPLHHLDTVCRMFADKQKVDGFSLEGLLL